LSPLAIERPELDNETVPIQKHLAVLAAAALAICLCGGARCSAALARPSTPQTATKSKPTPPPEARVDINHASAEELAKVPGLTPSWAGRIVRFRPYRTKQDLLERGVLPSDVYDHIKDSIIAHRVK
jgi:DNA uptake protein ComE-like DNA-binding protein